MVAGRQTGLPTFVVSGDLPKEADLTAATQENIDKIIGPAIAEAAVETIAQAPVGPGYWPVDTGLSKRSFSSDWKSGTNRVRLLNTAQSDRRFPYPTIYGAAAVSTLRRLRGAWFARVVNAIKRRAGS